MEVKIESLNSTIEVMENDLPAGTFDEVKKAIMHKRGEV